MFILKCSDNSYYTGHTDDIEKRISEHILENGCTYTKKRLPIKLIFSDYFATRKEALVVEDKIKKWSRKKKEAFYVKAYGSRRFTYA